MHILRARAKNALHFRSVNLLATECGTHEVAVIMYNVTTTKAVQVEHRKLHSLCKSLDGKQHPLFHSADKKAIQCM